LIKNLANGTGVEEVYKKTYNAQGSFQDAENLFNNL